jgi:hypothetical protein
VSKTYASTIGPEEDQTCMRKRLGPSAGNRKSALKNWTFPFDLGVVSLDEEILYNYIYK